MQIQNLLTMLVFTELLLISQSLETTCDAEGEINHVGPEELEQFVTVNSLVVAVFCVNSYQCDIARDQVLQASKTIDSEIEYLGVDAVRNPEVRQIYGITKYPTLRIFRTGLMQLEDYPGPFTALEIQKWAESFRTSSLSSRVNRFSKDSEEAAPSATTALSPISIPELQSLFHNTTIDVFVMFYEADCPAVTRMAAELARVAAAFRDFPTVSIARVDLADAASDAARAFTVHGLPAFYFFSRPDSVFGFRPGGTVYADLRTAPAMARFLARKCGLPYAQVEPRVRPATDSEAGRQESEAEGASDPPEWIFQPAGSQWTPRR